MAALQHQLDLVTSEHFTLLHRWSGRTDPGALVGTSLPTQGEQAEPQQKGRAAPQESPWSNSVRATQLKGLRTGFCRASAHNSPLFSFKN